eukprot:6178435-Amphidinium_carterae.1
MNTLFKDAPQRSVSYMSVTANSSEESEHVWVLAHDSKQEWSRGSQPTTNLQQAQRLKLPQC